MTDTAEAPHPDRRPARPHLTRNPSPSAIVERLADTPGVWAAVMTDNPGETHTTISKNAAPMLDVGRARNVALMAHAVMAASGSTCADIVLDDSLRLVSVAFDAKRSRVLGVFVTMGSPVCKSLRRMIAQVQRACAPALAEAAPARSPQEIG